MLNSLYFNPRTREGCDDVQYLYLYAFILISIHAPVKGATSLRTSVTNPLSHFNPRTREGCDVLDVLYGVLARHFNPRTREGCDVPGGASCRDGFVISIHAPVKGATCMAKRGR